jgi:hypothetical protein
MEEETPPTTEEGEAVTWPDHDLVAFDEPVADASPAAPEAVVTGGGEAGDAALLGVGAAALAGAGLYAESKAPSSGPDATDSSQHPGGVESIADVEGADATPLYVTLPPQAPAEREYFDSTDRAVVADDTAGAVTAGEPEDGLIVFVPEMDEPIESAMPALDAYPTFEPQATEPAAEAYIPPTVPVITSFDAAPSQSGTYRSVYDGMPDDGTPDDAAAEPSAESPAGSDLPSESERPGGFETLAELAGGAALGTGAAAVYEGFAQRDAPANEAHVAATEAAPASMESAPVVDAGPEADAVDAAAVLPDASGVAASDQAASTVDDSHHRMRHIRVVRQTVVGGEVIEETAAEEYIDEDADPEPVRARLRTMLEQQGGGRIADASTPEGAGGE